MGGGRKWRGVGGGGCPPQPGPPRPHLVRRFLGNAAPHPGGARHGAAHGGGGHRALRDGTCEQLRRAPSDVGREGSSSTCPCGDKTEGAETEPREVISERRENPERRAGSGYRGEEAVGLGGRCLRVDRGGACAAVEGEARGRPLSPQRPGGLPRGQGVTNARFLTEFGGRPIAFSSSCSGFRKISCRRVCSCFS